MRDAHVDASHIGVKVADGVVHLSGSVDNRRTKKLAEAIIEHLPGVKDVRNDLTII